MVLAGGCIYYMRLFIIVKLGDKNSYTVITNMSGVLYGGDIQCENSVDLLYSN